MLNILIAAAIVSVGETEMKTYPFSDPDPIPATAATRYPYFRYDGGSADGAMQAWRTVTLENDRIRVILLPDVGGKIWGATDKVTGRDFLYSNHVMKFRDIAMRGPWVSGGIEFNFGIIGHAPSSSTPVDWFVRTNADASVSCFVSAPEYITRTFWQVEVRLGRDADAFETHVVWYNASGLAAPYYHWMNAAYSVRDNPDLLFPARIAIGHQGEIYTEKWPLDAENRRIDSYANNNHGGGKSYHMLPGNNGFYGIWWPGAKFGSFHRSASYEKFGRKIFFWALSREGGIWEDLLTDADGQYTELQSGRCFNQPRYDNYLTPFKHPEFSPGSTETFAETWGPIRDRADVARDLALDRDEPRPRPYRRAADFDWTSAWGRTMRGTQYLRERHDAQGIACLREALALDPHLSPALVALAGAELRRGNLSETHALAERALAVDAYDPRANYLDGYAYFLEGDTVTARERLGVASLRTDVRSAALALVARSYLKAGHPAEAATAARKALAANDLNLDALLACAVAERGTSAAGSTARAILSRVPLFHAARYELERAGREKDFNRYIQNELPAESYLEMAYWYRETGYEDDARRLFALAGTNLMAKIELGDWPAAKGLPVAGSFPFRRESLASLEKAVAVDGHWKFRYLLAVLKASFGRDAEADALLETCANIPDEAVFYQYRATRLNGAARLADLERARTLGDNWRLGRQFAEHFEALKDYAGMLKSTTAYVKKYPRSNPLQIAHARALEHNRRYRDCMDYLRSVKLLPSEHRDSATKIWQNCQEALGEKITWPEQLGRGEPYPEDRHDSRQYEFQVDGRTKPSYPTVEDFERDTGWTLSAVDCAASGARAQDRRCFGDWTYRVAYRATGPKPELRLSPARPFAFGSAIPAGADTFAAWMWFDHFGVGTNAEAGNPNAPVFARFTAADGREKAIRLGALNWRGWHLLLAHLPKGLASFDGFTVTGCTQTEEYVFHVDAIGVFREDAEKPLAFRPSPKRNIAKALKGANVGNNLGAGTLPFPTREETSMPASGTPLAGELLAVFTGGAAKGPSPDKLEVTTRRIGRTLVVDLYAPAGAVTEVSGGIPSEAKVLGTVDVPYLAFDAHGQRLGVDKLAGGYYRLGFFDWYRSNASDFTVCRGTNGCELVAVYKPDTKGRYNAVSERFFLTLSPSFDEVLPTVANPVSPYRAVTGKKLWRATAANDPREDRRIWKWVHRLGLREVVVNDHETQWRDGGESFTTRTRAAPGKGGDEGLKDFSRYMREDLGFTYGPYNNFTDLGSANPEFRLSRVARGEDGRFVPAWMRCYGMRPVWTPEACDRFAAILKEKFDFNTSYCDVHTATAPWQRTDCDARVPGAATFAATYYAYGEVMLLQKRHFLGPVYSEGGHHMLYAGLTDGNYARDPGVRFNEDPWILDFDLRHLHDLECSVGMGGLRMFSPPETPFERQHRIPHGAGTRAELVDLIDRFIGATLAFGHTGFLVLDWCFEPIPKMQGRAIGTPSRFNPLNDIGMNLAMRSYYMVQQAAARYTQAKAEKILYFDAGGRAMDVSEAVWKGVHARCQVAVAYADGTRVAVNRHPERFRATAFGRALDLPPNGYAVWTEDGAVTVELGDRGGAGTKFDSAETPAYIFIDGRGAWCESAKAKSAGAAVCRREGRGWEIIPLKNVPCAFKIAGTKATALDFDGMALGPAEIRRDGDWLAVTPVPGAFSYRVE